MKALLEGIGKVPVVCAATPGFIVPRIQALAMNEAARMVEEGVASAEDIDKAIRYGFGFRFAVLGLLEFIDWGGGDILYYASRYLDGRARQRPLPRAGRDRRRNMREGRIGLRTGAGFLDYSGLDVDAYREKRLPSWSICSGISDWHGRRCWTILITLWGRHQFERNRMLRRKRRLATTNTPAAPPSFTTATPSSSIVVPIIGRSKCPEV